ncbi:MAG: iron-sulfur cluster assembly accessory protein [Meiothermus sp.]|nr:iron-sulfur cluster assembly accessory protein [Meiothermus sp.]
MVQEQTELTITPLAAERAQEILTRYNKPQAAIRVFIKSGGCSGYQYGMAVDERQLEGDTVVEMLGVRLVVDRMSLPLLAGSQVDWVENLMGGGFSVNNPQATSSCGCGHSFRTDGSKAPDGEGSGGCCS